MQIRMCYIQSLNCSVIRVRLGWKEPLEKGKSTYSSTFAWRIPWTEEPGGATVLGVAQSQTRLSD